MIAVLGTWPLLRRPRARSGPRLFWPHARDLVIWRKRLSVTSPDGEGGSGRRE